MTRKEIYRQLCREARGTGVGLLALIVLWCVFGFGGFAVFGGEPLVLGLPFWALAGTVGIWLTAIGLVWVLTHGVFRDMPLEDGAVPPPPPWAVPRPLRGRTGKRPEGQTSAEGGDE